MAKSCLNVIEIIDSDDEPDISHNVGAKSSSVNVVIDIIGSDEEPDISQNVPLNRRGSGNISVTTSEEKVKNLDNNPNVLQDMQGSGNNSPSTCFEEEKGKNLDSNHGGNNEENFDVCQDILFTSNTKRKRACNVVMSESESDRDDDDNMSNSLTTTNLVADKVTDDIRMPRRRLKTQRIVPDKVTDDIRMPRRRLKTLRKIGSKSRGDKTYQQCIPTNGDDELEEDLSYSEEDNMSDFIVDDDFDVSDSEDMSNESQDESNSDAESNSGSLQNLQDNNKDSHLQDVSDRKGSGNISLSTCSAAEKGKNFDSNYAENNEGNSDLGEDLLCVVTSKRKPNRNVVISESENDDGEDFDDDLPISTLKSNLVKEISVDELINVVNEEADDVDADADVDDDMPISQVIRMKKPRRRRLKPLRKCVSKSNGDKVNYQQRIPTNNDAHDGDDESMEDLSQSDEGNLSDFINDDFDVSNCEVASSKSQDRCNGNVDSDDSNNSQDLQDRSKDSNLQDLSDDDYDKLLSKIQRKKKQKIKWESEPEMLADLGKDPVLCMKAVCVLYRQQTGEEQEIKGTVCRNGRGFNTHDAYRGSKLAEFLLDGSPDGSINKTVEELQNFMPDGVEVCESLAFNYSKQLFEIFENKEDDFFP
ncbi:myb-like protein D isoform X1 [Trifolium pratense]|uniref:myb-like protein D isoform X1 n=1 Tax=Trifolium pratense TaxID=57577 RepID=UPI001E694CD9|nr:myb-like protein D isoform X1 [Trifolium pratense]XP_045808372.1 myb-like protein D isoform X1 [Trifolium pratense]